MTDPVNKVVDDKTFSPLQSIILDALSGADRPIPASAILSRYTTAPTAQQRASLSRSLARLESRGLVLRYVPEVCRPGRGYLYSLNPAEKKNCHGLAQET